MTEHCASPAHKEASSAESVAHDAPAAPEHPSAQNPDPGRIYISEVQRHQARYRKLIQFTSSSTKAAGAMLLAAIAALCGAATCLAGCWAAGAIDAAWLQKGLGTVLLFIGCKELLAKEKQAANENTAA